MSTVTAILATQAYQLIQGNKINTLRSSRVTPNFTWGELLVHRSLQDLQSIKLKHLEKLVMLAQRLEKVRSQLGNRSITITSGWRDMLTNQRVGGARLSRHLIGEAVDIVVSGLTPKQVQDALESTWEGGLGYGATFTHLDIRGHRTRFRY